MKRLDCAGLSSILDDARFGFVAGITGPDILFPLVWRSTKKLTVFGLSHRIFAAIWTRISMVLSHFVFKFRNTRFQCDNALPDRKDAKKQTPYTFG